MTGSLSKILGNETKLKPLSPGAKEAIESVEALAVQQSNAPQSAMQTTPLPEHVKGITCAIAINPGSGVFDFTSSNPLNVEVQKLNAEFRFTVRF